MRIRGVAVARLSIFAKWLAKAQPESKFNSPIKVAKRILIASVMLGVGLLGGEYWLQGLGYSALVSSLGSYEPDSTLGWVIKPNQRLFRSTWAYSHFTYSDSNGEPALEPGQMSASVSGPQSILIGDSFLEGFYVPYQNSFAHRLTHYFSDSHVRNLGVSGYGPEQYLLAARKKLVGVNVKRTILFFYAFNDLPYLGLPSMYGLYAKPVLSHDLQRVENAPINPLKTFEEIRGQRLSAVLSFTLPWLGVILGKEAPILPPGSLETPVVDTRKLARALEISGQIFSEFPSTCNLIVYVPSYEEIQVGELVRNREKFFSECRKKKIQCLWPARFAESPRLRDFYYSRDNQRHFNEIGSEFFFEAVRTEIEKNPNCAPK